ncbi:hypothetical protein GCM10025867_10160 [Frondihabitans sucicola]|uniref:Uncharacterized protein n=1 Tax=Frondihabitans sucicola TaxID=1268041 RepID=A0ABN6XUS8_9MICO|nr:hypothetical protein GCM10025867_10160 [Frondihabitans sucicola]
MAADRFAEVHAAIPVPDPVPVPVPVPGVDDALGDVVVLSLGVGAGAAVTVFVAVGVLAVSLLAEQPASPAAVRQATAMIVILVVVRIAPAWHGNATSVDQSQE